MRYWWVNQNQTYRQEQQGGYLWSPKRRADGAFNHYYDMMHVVTPGDLVLSFQGTRIRALGRVNSCGYESPKPLEFGAA
jgi:putative restriction endonuclease